MLARLLCLLLTVSLAIGSASWADDVTPLKYALLIGVKAYDRAILTERANLLELLYPEDDAQAIGNLLKQSGYKVDLLLGAAATRAAVLMHLQRAREQEGHADGVVLVGLFGHGVQYDDDSYFIPCDGTLRPVTDASGRPLMNRQGQPLIEPDPASLVSLTSIVDELAASRAGHRVILADCSRDASLRARGFGRDQIVGIPPDTGILFACSSGEQSFEHPDWKHGAFAHAVLQVCGDPARDPPRTLAGLATEVEDQVDRLVEGITGGRNRQRVHLILNGTVRLFLQRVAERAE